jgi:hypothetical protein
VRGLRSAVSMYHRLDMQVARPGQAYFDGNDRALLALKVSPTDEMSSVLMNKGMRGRLGDGGRPSEALVEAYVLFLDRSLDSLFLAAPSPATRLELARAGAANVTAWLGWLRSFELFWVLGNEIEVVPPRDSPRFTLPLGISLILYRLNEETKGNRSQTADVVLAGTAASTLSPYKWFRRLQHLLDLTSPSLLFCHPNGVRWSSSYFRSTYLLPSLNAQRLAGKASLQVFDGSPGNTLAEKFYSINSYRRGARSHVSKKRPSNVRKASPDEVTEHGRWRVERSSMSMPEAYQQWTVADRLSITQLCM